jgi:hypothetical protein
MTDFLGDNDAQERAAQATEQQQKRMEEAQARKEQELQQQSAKFNKERKAALRGRFGGSGLGSSDDGGESLFNQITGK